MSEASATELGELHAENANAALGPLEVLVRRILQGHDLQAALAELHGRRSRIVARLAAGEHLTANDRSIVYRCEDGCYEELINDMNTGEVTRRRHYAPHS